MVPADDGVPTLRRLARAEEGAEVSLSLSMSTTTSAPFPLLRRVRFDIAPPAGAWTASPPALGR
jgi:hypothetical protein